MTRVALDLEEVLADTISETCRSTDNIEPNDFSSWDLDDYTWQVYAGVSDALWRHDPLSIPPVEPGLPEYTATIMEESERLDIVTARMNVDESVELWLEHHDISYEDIISTRTPKYELDYDLYIDDNPQMVGHCRLLLRHHLHNDGVSTDESKSCDRIHSLAEVAGFL